MPLASRTSMSGNGARMPVTLRPKANQAKAKRVHGSPGALLSGRRIDCGGQSGNLERLLGRKMLVMRRRDQQPIGGMNNGNRIAPGIAAALIGFRRAAGVIVIAALGKVARFRGMGMLRAGVVMRVALRARRRMIVILRRRARMTRPAARGESERQRPVPKRSACGVSCERNTIGARIRDATLAAMRQSSGRSHAKVVWPMAGPPDIRKPAEADHQGAGNRYRRHDGRG